MPTRRCLTPGCHNRTTTGSTCPPCTKTGARGYGHQWQTAAAAAIDTEPWCHTPGGCPHPDSGTPTNPLTGDHPAPMARGGDPLPAHIDVRCRRCNSTKGAR